VTLFYSALNFVEALFIDYGKPASENHGMRKRNLINLGQELPWVNELYEYYDILFRYAWEARYNPLSTFGENDYNMAWCAYTKFQSVLQENHPWGEV